MEEQENQIIECVINISEGRNDQIIDQISMLLNESKQVHVLHVDRGIDVNRTVFTIVGNLLEVYESLEKLIKYALIHLDIENHSGIHPRIGIIDVIPFIPIANINQSDLKDSVREFGKRIGSKFSLPIFFYGSLSTIAEFESLSGIRKGGIKRLSSRLQKDLYANAGPQKLNKILGGSCITVRDFMVAFNINLNTTDIEKAKKLSRFLIYKRQSDFDKTDLDIGDVKFLAWSAQQYNCCQLSTNIYNINKVNMLSLYRYVKKYATQLNVELRGSELIGITPLKGICHNNISIEAAIKELGLNSVREFNQEEHILEFKLEDLNLNILI